MKKILSLIIVLLSILSLIIPSYAEGTEIPYDSSWKIELSSDIGGTKGKLFDNNPATFWHSHYTVEGGKITKYEDCPHVIKIDFGKDMTVSGLIYTPRSDSNSGTMRQGNVYGTTDGKTYVKIAEFPLIPDAKRFDPQFCSWGNKSLKGIALEITQSYGGYASAGELDLVRDSVAKAENAVTKSGVLGVGEYGKGAKELKFLNDWTVEVSSDIGGTKGRLFDGNNKTYWHSYYAVEDGKVGTYEKCPHTITITFPSNELVSGLCYIPRQDAESGTMRAGNVYGSVDGTNFERLGGYALTSDAKRFENQICSWGDKSLKAIRLEITSSYGNFGSCAELVVLTGGEAGEVITEAPKVEEEKKYTIDNAVDRSGWTVKSSSEISPAGNILDGKEKTYWHSKYYVENGKITGSDMAPFYLDINLPELTEISEFVFLPRTDNHSGDILRMSFYASDSDEGEYVKLVENAEFKISDSGALGLLQNVRLAANIKVKRIRLEVLEGRGGYGSMAEFFVLKPLSTLETIKLSDYEKYAMENALYEIDRDGFSVYYGGKNWNGNELPRAFDGYRNTIWQTETVKETESVVAEIDMGKVYTIKEMHYLPRQSEDMHGLWLEVKIHTSMDGMDYKEVKHTTLEKTLAEKIIVFEEEITARYIDIEVVKFNAQRVSATEIRFFESSKAREARLNKEKATYVLKIGSPAIEVTSGGATEYKTLDVAPYIVNGSTLIPLRGLVEEMGAQIIWDGAKEKITIAKEGIEINLQIWNDLVYVDDSRYGQLKYTLLNPPVITESRTFIPVRFVSEILGYNVSWDGETQTVTITK